MSSRSVLAANNLFALLAKLLEGGKSVLVALLVIQFFSPDEFGVYSVAIAVGSVVAIVAEFRLMGILLRLYSQFPSITSRLITNAIAINIAFALLGISVTALSFLFVDELLFQCLILFSLSYLFKFGRCIRGVLVAERQNVWVATIEIISGILVLSSITLALLNNASIQTVVLIRALDFLVVSLLYVYVARGTSILERKTKQRAKLSPRLIGFLVKKSFPLVLSGAAMLLFQRIDLILIQSYLSSTQAGIYAAATAVVSVFGIVALVLSESLAPKLFTSNKYPQSEEHKRTCDADLRFGQVVMLLGLIMSILSFWISPLVIHCFFSAEYRSAIDVAKVLSLTPFAISLGAFAGQVIIKHKLEQGVFVKSIVACFVSICLNLWWIPQFGITGAAWATVVGLMVANYLSHFFIVRLKPIFVLQNQVVVELLEQLIPRFKNAESRR
ncbi:polysaccharide biosynthesis C-terminal domain-containing protein [Psychrosphaera ytuae]|uniref:Polysaccharide biosynthesis C-terminal domain-containing protein n=1 Tax=Psychrosphaera ytuae TaxID=2820710 RepID=A0A975DDC2_9GAMM|nr:polysaccharide biosynthesis C-terminal domain-containing protein [Psychrosphaera ytuae]QTH64614.1 polysaccharide biosynthesis C-terminal domain-containing protein [Psychrosphaera ytuae]